MSNSVNSKIISWARKRAGYNFKNLPKKITAEKLKKWESGCDQPTFTQLESLSETFKLPVAVFFFPNPPDIPETIKKFRSLPSEEILKFSPDTYKKLHLAQSYQDSLYYLAEDLAPEKKIFKDINGSNLSSRELAIAVRDYLEVPIEKQIKLTSTEKAFKFWRKKIENAGVFTFKDTFKDRFISGFCLLDKEYPIIFINNSTGFARQIFTLIHELCHILCGINGITTVENSYINDMSSSDRKLEIFCNEFAGDFLVPFEEFLKDIEYYKRTGPDSIINIAKKYSVSREVILRKLLDNGVVDQNYYETKSKQWIDEYLGRKSSSGGGDYYLKTLAYLGEGFSNIVYENLRRGRIDSAEASEHLHVRAINLDKLHHVLER